MDALCHFAELPIGNGGDSLLQSSAFGVSRQLKAKRHFSEEDEETEQQLPKRRKKSKKRNQRVDSDAAGLTEF